MNRDFLINLRVVHNEIVDLAGNKWTSSGVVATPDGKWGGGIKCTTEGGNLTQSNSKSIWSDDFTISVWAKISRATYDVIWVYNRVDPGPLAAIYLYHSYLPDCISFTQPSNMTTSGLTRLSNEPFPYKDGLYHHFALTRKDEVLRTFIDGRLVYTKTLEGKCLLSDKDVIICLGGGSGLYFDDFCVINDEALWTSDFTTPSTYLFDNTTKLMIDRFDNYYGKLK